MKSRPCLPQAASSGCACRCSVVGGRLRCRLPGLARRAAALRPRSRSLSATMCAQSCSAGVVHAQQHLRPARQRGQHFERLLRQRGDAEHHHAPRARQARPASSSRARSSEGLVAAKRPVQRVGAAVAGRRRRAHATSSSSARHRRGCQRRSSGSGTRLGSRGRGEDVLAPRPSRPASRRGRPGTGRTGRPGARPAGGACAGRRRRSRKRRSGAKTGIGQQVRAAAASAARPAATCRRARSRARPRGPAPRGRRAR